MDAGPLVSPYTTMNFMVGGGGVFHKGEKYTINNFMHHGQECMVDMDVNSYDQSQLTWSLY